LNNIFQIPPRAPVGRTTDSWPFFGTRILSRNGMQAAIDACHRTSDDYNLHQIYANIMNRLQDLKNVVVNRGSNFK
jgi:hypothetical protein